MKPRHVCMNILPLPIWLLYYFVTLQKNDLFMVKLDEIVLLGMLWAFTIYNLFSHKVIEVFVKNLILSISLVSGCYISGQMYLKLCYHMSDEHYAVNSITFDYAIYAVILICFACLIRFIMNKIKSRRNGV